VKYKNVAHEKLGVLDHVLVILCALQGLSAHVTNLHKISRVNKDLKLAKRYAVKYVC